MSRRRPLQPSRHTLLLGAVLAASALARLLALDRYPAGLHFDEAVYALQGRAILQQGDLRLYYEEYTGHEPLFLYWLVAVYALLGPTLIAARVAAALVGTATVAATYLAGRALLGRWPALLGAALLGGGLWTTLLDRSIYRALTQPLLAALATWLLWHALRPTPPALQSPAARRWLARHALAGLATGLLLYTYVAARFALVGLVVWLALALLLHRRWLLRRWPGLLLFLVISGLAMLPLLGYWALHPESFAVRFEQTSALAESETRSAGERVLTSALRTLAMFSQRGDANWKYNFAAQPVFGWPLALAFYLGLALALRRLLRPRASFLLLWLLFGLLPGCLTTEAPNFLRTLGAAPPAYLLAGLGLWSVGRWVGRRLPHPPPPSPMKGEGVGGTLLPHMGEGVRGTLPQRTGVGNALLPLLAALVVLASFAGTARDYFLLWAPSARAFAELDGDLTLAGQALAERRLGEGERVYVSAGRYRDPIFAFLAQAQFDSLKWFNGRSALVLPPATAGARWLVVPASARGPLLERWLPPPVEQRLGPGGSPAYALYRLEPALAARLTPERQLPARLGDAIEVLGYDLPETVRAGENVDLTLYWRVQRRPDHPHDLFLHVLDARGHDYGEKNAQPYLTPEWEPGETVVTQIGARVDADAPPGRYHLEFGFFDRLDGSRLQPDGEGATGRGSLRTVGFQVLPPAADTPPPPAHPQHRVDARFGAALTLLGYSLRPAEPVQGDRLRLTLFWQVGQPMPGAYQAVLRLLDPAGAVRAERIAPLAEGADPPATWGPGRIVREEQEWPLDPRLPAGESRLWLGLRGPDGALLPAGEGEGLVLGTVVVAPRPRQFTPPEPGHRQEARFGDLAALVGYDLSATRLRPGERLQVTLHWQALATAPPDRVVFLHLVGEDERVLTQHDGPPAGGARPTSTWEAGEYLADARALALPSDLPPGRYRLALGWYDPLGGDRLLLPDGASRLLLDAVIIVEPANLPSLPAPPTPSSEGSS